MIKCLLVSAYFVEKDSNLNVQLLNMKDYQFTKNVWRKKKMWKEIMFRAFKTIAKWAITKLYNYVDKDDNGQLSKEEIADFVSFVRSHASKIKKKL